MPTMRKENVSPKKSNFLIYVRYNVSSSYLRYARSLFMDNLIYIIADSVRRRGEENESHRPHG